MKIYTKKGDKGSTSLIGGTRVSKGNIRLHAYGTVDELNSHIGIVRSVVENKEVKDELFHVQNCLFTLGSLLAADPENNKMKLPTLEQEDVDRLERSMDKMEEELPELKNFILPGGSRNAAFIHVARCVCRRAERHCVEIDNIAGDELIIPYLNRLSDYLFVLSRFVSMLEGAGDVKWEPRQN